MRGYTTEQQRRSWREDGVVCIRDALTDETLRMAREAIEWSARHAGPNSYRQVSESGAENFQDRANPAALSRYGVLAKQPEFKAVLDELWGVGDVWFIFEQVFIRRNGASPPTQWHQDTLYMPTRGDRLATVWFCLGDIPRNSALEVIPGSHRGPLYNGIKAHPDEGTVPLFDRADIPPLPDIEAEREKWPITSWATGPRDLLIFHPSILHGGGQNRENVSRQTVTLRFFGEDTVVSDLDDGGVYRCSADEGDPAYHPVMAMYRQPTGSPFQHPHFPKL